MILTSENDVIIFWETIKQLEPESVLDIGMFLKRIGSISRRIMDREVAESMRMDGVDFFPQVSLPVWKNVYDGIISAETFLEMGLPRRYDLAILLGTRELREKMPRFGLPERASEYAEYILSDDISDISEEQKVEWKITSLRLHENIYYLICSGE